MDVSQNAMSDNTYHFKTKRDRRNDRNNTINKLLNSMYKKHENQETETS